MLARRSVLTLALAAGLAGFAPGARAQTAAKLPVVASFSILADFVRQVGGDRVQASALVGPNGDAHVYQPTPADAKTMAGARLIVVNGLGLEGWIARLVKASGAKGAVVTAAAAVTPIAGEEPAGKAAHAHAADPHAWQDVANARRYVAAIRDGLAAADPDGRADYEARATAYLGQLDALDAEIRAAVARIPADRRRIITTHDAFGYFGRAYGVTFIAPQGVSTESEASAADVARIIRQIRAEKASAVFLENVSDPRLMQRIAKESGARVGGRLFSDALSEQGGPAGTYIDMMRNNIRELSAALSS
ncbi:ABC transporter substrate-binding protein [Alsobacter metallidurans]|uniref:ABC transporter substrate-binding protein n=1 Tax=Alsobacter metallidurans TaxID=340221 RepID=A0A917IBR5_9HYPH|nr:zinc ABC transporter substrate-binding protein [Alsobacter metallidurans]GGH30633.1 ABC transporter substrate-binding protein [Alsobacter metallidurans]